MAKIVSILILLMTYLSSGQYLHVFDIDTTDFPIMRAKFFASDAAGNQIYDLQASDFEVTENGEVRDVLSVSCPVQEEPIAISSVLTIDVSGSMLGGSLEIAKEASESWVKGLPLGKSECSITSFNSTNQFVKDFTTDRNTLLEKISKLSAEGGTDFNAAFIDPLAGGLLALEKAKHKKVMVLLTDGYARGNENQILSKAQSIDATVFCVTIGFKCPDILKNISEQTGGMWFENVTSIEEAKRIYNQLLTTTQELKLCEIEWKGENECTSEITALFDLLPYKARTESFYNLPKDGISHIEINPSAILFVDSELGINRDTTISIISHNHDITITNIKTSNTNFDITPKSLTLKKGEAKVLTMTYIPKDQIYEYTKIKIESNFCDEFFYASSIFSVDEEQKNILKIVQPKGSEKFLVGSDTIITWEGILPSDTVMIEHSNDNGQTWNLISSKATDLKCNWKNIPKPKGNNNKIKVSYFNKNQNKSNGYILDLAGHNASVNQICWSPNKSKLATASNDNTAKIWDTRTGVLLHSLNQHSNKVNSVIWNPDGNKVATASDDNTAIIWDANSGDILHILKGHTNKIVSLDWSPDGKNIVTASTDNTAKIWDSNTGELIHTLIGHSNIINCVDWNPISNKIATASLDHTAIVWDASTGALLYTLEEHTNFIYFLQWSHDGSKLATASWDHTAKIWDSNSGSQLQTLVGHSHAVISVDWSPNDKKLATASWDNTAKIWDVNSGTSLYSLARHNDRLNHLKWNENGSQIVTTGDDNTARVWNATSGKLLLTLYKHTEKVNYVDWSLDGSQIATASSDYSAIIWDSYSGNPTFTLGGHTAPVSCAQWSPDGNLIATASDDNLAIIWDAHSGAPFHFLNKHTKSVSHVSWSPDGTKVATASWDKKVIIWNANTGTILHKLGDHLDNVKTVNWSPDGTKIVTASSDNTAKVWETKTGMLLNSFYLHSNAIRSANWSPDGNKVATASWDNTAKIWDVNSGDLIHSLNKHTESVNYISWSPDGNKVATASWDNTAKIWDVNSGDLIHSLNKHTESVNYISWSPDGNKVATASNDSIGIIWDVISGVQIHELSGHNGSLTYISWSPDGSKLATASKDNSCRIWDARSGLQIHKLLGHKNSVTCINWSPNGLNLVTASYDHTAKLWSLDDNISDSQEDTSDIFSIVAPEVESHDIDMGDVVVATSKDSIVTDFINNIGQWECRIDTIYFVGNDSSYFRLNGPLPVYTVDVGAQMMSEFKFSPTEVRDYAVKVVIVTQADTLYQDIIGRGVEEQIAANSEIIDFGIRELYHYADTTVTLITNVSNDPINITKIEMIGPDKEQFLFLDPNQTAPFTLQANTDYNMNLRFNPKYMGRTSGQIAFHFNGAGSPAIAQLFGAGIGAELSASKDSAYVGDVIGIDIKFVNNNIEKFAKIIGSYEGVVRVESSILGTIHKEDLVKIKSDSAFINFKGEVIPENNVLATIPLKVTLGRVTGTTIDFEFVKWFDTDGNELVYDTDFSSGYFKQLGICEQGGKRLFNPSGEAGISSLSPNPASDKLHIKLNLTEKGQTKLELYDALGKLSKVIIEEEITDFGEREINESIKELPSGSYSIILTTPTIKQTKNLIISR